MSEFAEIMVGLLQGFGNTCLLFAITLVFALPLGLIIAFGAMSKFKPLKFLTKIFVWIIRGTPLMLQILLVSFLPKYLFQSTVKEWALALNFTINQMSFVFVAIAFIINYAAYFSEIYRSGIESISKGQYEAGKVLGMTKIQIFFKIVLLQVIKHILPPMSNETITLVKDTVLAFTLSVVDLLTAAKEAVNNFVTLSPLIYAGIFFLVFNGLLSVLFNYIEKKLSFYKE
ncbi:MAG: amino acid ABC transporter permease [Clostridiales bacterium]|nr:amino acid ABC transporter permease [Clostridiales bacterium]